MGHTHHRRIHTSSGRPLLDPEQLSEGTPRFALYWCSTWSTIHNPGPSLPHLPQNFSPLLILPLNQGAQVISSLWKGEPPTRATTPIKRERSYTSLSLIADLSLRHPRFTTPGESETYSRDLSRTHTKRTTMIGSDESGGTLETCTPLASRLIQCCLLELGLGCYRLRRFLLDRS